MKYETYLKVMSNYQKFQSNIDSLYEVGVDLMEGKYAVSNIPLEIMEVAFASHYTKEGWDWITWFIFENEWGQKDWSRTKTYLKITKGKIEFVEDEGDNHYGAMDKDGNPLAYNLESLYNLLEQDYKIK